MIRFKEHDNQLFRMLEEPVPLTPDAEMPCLVRLIQDDSPMGLYNKNHRDTFRGIKLNCFLLPIVAIFIDNNNIVNAQSWEYYRYEIIGYPVAEGSHWWALYQMMHGKWVYNPSLEKHKSDKLDTRYLHAYGKFGQDIVVKNTLTGIDSILGAANISHWTNYAEPSGWQIYTEPKPEPIFTTGDKVTDGVIDGTIIHIEDAIADVCPSTDEYKIELRNLNHISESPKQDDVEKPLRSMIAEAKAIGKNIRTYYQDIVFTPQALEACLNQGEFRWWNICNWELTDREQNYYPSISTSSDRPKEEPQHAKEPIADCDNCKHACTKSNIDHCQMYEPKPTFKVGDWVEYNGGFGRHIGRIDAVSPGGSKVHIYVSDTHGLGVDISCLRKLSPSEIVVRIGCLSGTVEKSSLFHKIGFIIVTKAGNCWISFDALDKETRDLVESLLEAMREEK